MIRYQRFFNVCLALVSHFPLVCLIIRKRCGKVEEIAALVAFAASEEAGFTTGFCWDATGGRSVY